MIQAVFLDAGLTLLYTDPPVERVYTEAFARHGLAAPEPAVRAAVHETWRAVRERQVNGGERWGGNPGEEPLFWRRFVQAVYSRSGGDEAPGAMHDELVEHFAKDASWRVYDDVLGTLDALKRAGLKLLVVSNWDRTLPKLLARMDLAKHFHAIVTSGEVGSAKPARGIFEAALKLAGVPAGAALHVGDSAEEDYEGAVAAGLSGLHLDRSRRGPEAPHRIVSLSEIPARLGIA